MPTTKCSNFELSFIAASKTAFSVAQATAHCIDSQFSTSAMSVDCVCEADRNFTSISAFPRASIELSPVRFWGTSGEADCSCSDRHVKPSLAHGLAGCVEKGMTVGLELGAVLGHQVLVSG
ncbi:hypothetical protein D3C77_571540 [compost metagenome]